MDLSPGLIATTAALAGKAKLHFAFAAALARRAAGAGGAVAADAAAKRDRHVRGGKVVLHSPRR